MNKDLPFYVALSEAPGIGPGRFKVLIEHFKKAEKVWKASDKLLAEILTKKIFEEFDHFLPQAEIISFFGVIHL